MKRLLVKAGCVATLDDSIGTLTRGAILVEDGTIAAVGSYDELSRRGPFDEEVGSLEYDLLMPGLTSAHHHSGRTFLEGHSDRPLECWLPYVFGVSRSGFSDEDHYLNTAWSCIELIRGGCTSAVDHHTGGSPHERQGIPSVVQAYRTVGMRVAVCVGIGDLDRFYYGGDEEVLKRLPPEAKDAVRNLTGPPDLDQFFEVWDSLFQELHEPKGRVRIFLGPLGAHRCSGELLRRVKDSARRCKTGIQLHLLETLYQRASGPRIRGKSLVSWLEELGFWGEEVSCAHGIWVSEEDLAILKERGVTVVHNPSSNLRSSSGIAPIRIMMEHGVPLAIGGDGFGANDDNDLLMDLRLGHMLQRLPGISVPPISPEDWFKMAVKGGARVLLQSESLGSLSQGKKADFILVDMKRIRHPTVNPSVDPLSLLLQRGLGRDVHTVYVDGQAVMREGKILTIDEEAIAKELKKSMERHYPRYEALRPEYLRVEEEIRNLLSGWDVDLPAKARYQYNLH